MSFPNPSSALAYVVVDELIRNGVSFAVASPGSRSTALVLALEDRPEVELTMQLDERSAGFRALGASVAQGRPTVVLTTSGSAVANLAPAVVEAERSGVPIILLTADRPADHVARRANQTMDHFGVFSGFVRSRAALGAPSAEIDGNAVWRQVVSDLVSIAVGGEHPPGPVHLNVAFSEPTVPVSDDGRSSSSEYSFAVPVSDRRGSDEIQPDLPGWELAFDSPVLAVAGKGAYDAPAFARHARALGIPVISTATSGARGEPGTLSAYNHWLVMGFPKGLAPKSVLIAGQVNPADRLIASLTGLAQVVHVDPFGVFSDPGGSMTEGIRADPVDLIKQCPSQDPAWGAALTGLDEAVRAALLACLDEVDGLAGPVIANVVGSARWGALVVGSSLAIRDVEAHLTRGGWVHSNRGVSGIDGFASTVLGVAGERNRTLGLAGDLSFLHDSNAFLTERIPAAVFVVIDNQGGGLFDLLPQATYAPNYERLFVTPHRRDFADLAIFHNLAFSEAEDRDSLAVSIAEGLEEQEPTLIRAAVDRPADLVLRSALDESAHQVLADFR